MLLTVEPFALYHMTWWIYLGLGLVFLLLVWWKIRHWHFASQIVLLAFFASFAFSFTQVPESETYAPAAIALILELENEGSAGEIRMIIHILLVWFIMMLLAASLRLAWLNYQEKRQQLRSNNSILDPKNPESNNLETEREKP